MTGELQLELPFDLPPAPEPERKAPPHYEEPRNDNEWLLEFQYRFRTAGDQAALANLIKLGETIALKFVNKESRKNRHVRALALWQRKDKAHDAFVYFIERYQRDPAWIIDKNYPGYIYLRVQHELYYQREVDKIVDFVDLDEFFKTGTDDEPIDDGEWRFL